MALPVSEIQTAHALNHVAIQVTVDCFTPHDVTYLRAGRMICHEEHVSLKTNAIKSNHFFLITIF